MNHPADVNGIRFYQINFGWAPVLTVRDADGVAFDDTVVMDRDPAPDGVPEFAMPWRGVIKLPGAAARPSRAAPTWRSSWSCGPTAPGSPTSCRRAEPTVMLKASNPVIRYTVWQGKLTEPRHQPAGHVVHGGDRARARGGGRRTDEIASGGLDMTLSFPELAPVLGVPSE